MLAVEIATERISAPIGGPVRAAIAGAHGQVATRLARVLIDRGDDVIGLIRNPRHAEDLRAAGVDPQICDLEHATVDQIAATVGGSDAVVFAAGAGPGSGAARKLTMDHDGAIKLLDATAVDSCHYVMLSGIGVENPPDGTQSSVSICALKPRPMPP